MKPLKIKKPPFFKPGSLVFLESKHKLVKDGKYYRCTKKTNQLCQFEEKPLLAESFERKFSRLALKLQDKKLDPDVLIERLMRDNLCDLIFGVEKKAKTQVDIAEYTVSAVNADVLSGKSVSNQDHKDFDMGMVELMKADHSIILFGYAISMIRAFAVEMPEAEMGRMLAHYSKRIYLSNEGEIIGIELERWAWYCFNVVIEKNNPGYLQGREEFKFLNKPDVLHDMSLVKAALSFGSEDFPNAMGENFMLSIGMVKVLKDSISFAVGGDMAKMNQAMPEFMNQIMKNPAIGIIMRTLSVSGIKIK